jgi:hypothetical protein
MPMKKNKRQLIRDAAKALTIEMNSKTLFRFACAAVRATRPDAGLLWAEVLEEIHFMLRGNALECNHCPYKLDSGMLVRRMEEHGEISQRETEWNVEDEIYTHEEIYCKPCSHWGQGTENKRYKKATVEETKDTLSRLCRNIKGVLGFGVGSDVVYVYVDVPTVINKIPSSINGIRIEVIDVVEEK